MRKEKEGETGMSTPISTLSVERWDSTIRTKDSSCVNSEHIVFKWNDYRDRDQPKGLSGTLKDNIIFLLGVYKFRDS